jgi:hypothetical protein
MKEGGWQDKREEMKIDDEKGVVKILIIDFNLS